MAEDLFEKGMRIRREVLGDTYVDNSWKEADDFDRDILNLATEFCWGALWGREGLSRKQRSLNNLSILAALNRPQELELHVRAALRNGCTMEEIRETLLQVAVYAGMPAGHDAIRIAHRVLREEGVLS